MSVKIPKYKSIPSYALKYAKRKGKLPLEQEKVFLKDISCAIEYAVNIKKDRLIPEVEQKILDFYCFQSELSLSEGRFSESTKSREFYQKLYFDDFFKYLSIIKNIPKKYEEHLLKNLEPETMVQYSKIMGGKRLDEKYEEILLEKAIAYNKPSSLVEYSYSIGCKLPESMHNYLLSCYIKDCKNNLVLDSYFSNLKKIKNQLQKITQVFDKDKSIQEIIDQL